MGDRAPHRRTVLEGMAAGSVVALVGSAAGSAQTGLERRCPTDEEIAIEPGSTVLFETEGAISGEPLDAEWGGGGERGGTGGLLVGDYTYATGRPASFRTFESTGAYDVTCAYGGDEIEWTVHVESGGAGPRPRSTSRPTRARASAPNPTRRSRSRRVRPPRTATSSNSSGSRDGT